MKRWPLRWKIAFYAAGLGVVATIAGAATTWTLMHFAELRAFDARLQEEGAEMLAVLSSTPGVPKSQWLGPAWHDRLVELRTTSGELRYRSPHAEDLHSYGGKSRATSVTINGRRYRVNTVERGDLRLAIAGDLGEINAIGRDIVFGMLGAIPTVLAVVFLGGQWVARRALGPVDALQQAAAQITPRNLEQRLPMPAARDEIAGLVSVLNQTFDRLQRSFEQSIRFSADASHHLKTPIAILRAGIEEILRDPASSAEQQRRADSLLHQTHQLTSIAENLLLLARADAGRLELNMTQLDLCELLDGIRDDLQALAEPTGIRIETNLPKSLPIVADRFAVSLILQNLFDNAVKFNRHGGLVRVTAESDASTARVSVGNSGAGIPPDRSEHIFERFARARGGTVQGQGLGLSIAQELARAQRGELSLLRHESDWTEFVLTFPLTGTNTIASNGYRR